jgi:hypothetical protein
METTAIAPGWHLSVQARADNIQKGDPGHLIANRNVINEPCLRIIFAGMGRQRKGANRFDLVG